MFRKILCLLLALALAVLCCSCNMRGETKVLDTYSVQALYDTYTAVRDGTLKVQIPRTETIPQVRTAMMQSPIYYSKMASLYFYNESTYYLTIHGYAWITEPSDPDNAHKAIYYNNVTEVSNSTYEIRLDPDHNAYLLFELLDGTEQMPTKESIYYIFFLYEDTEYVGAATAEDEFVLWPLSQTIVGASDLA